MRWPSVGLLTAGLLLLIGLTVWQGFTAVFAALAAAGWTLLLVALFHLLPLVIDGAAIRVLFVEGTPGGSWRDTLLARWAGESANSLMPLGQVAGPVVMARDLSRRLMPMPEAAAAVTVSTTLQALAQIAFGLIGVALLIARESLGGSHPAGHARSELVPAALAASGVLAAILVSFYWVQRRGLFGSAVRTLARFSGRHGERWLSGAEAIDRAVESTYRRTGRAAASFALSLAGWLAGTGEVYLALRFIGSPVGWLDALMLESLGQAIRGAAFAVPGALGVQEGGFLLLAPVAGIAPHAALALSFAKRAREILLGLPGLAYLHRSERSRRRMRGEVAEDSPSRP
ncbi:MAG TPA: lysylphosphatidylglycerol synthase domain-containing protein [Steroidobacteraceae bacterium]|nr:lysylphosphatidylglycerol synthase domain-containing protein [Steroidobacteraceae bacterium]